MPRERDRESGGAGRPAVRSFRDDDWEDLVATVRDLPAFARDEGFDRAIAFGMTELRTILAQLNLSRPASKEEAFARSWVRVFLTRGSVRLLCEPDMSGFNHATDFLIVVAHEYFEPSVRAVFERSAPSESQPYRPTIPREE